MMQALTALLAAAGLLGFDGVTAQYNNLYTTNLSAFWNATTYPQAQTTNVTKLTNQGYAMALQFQSPILHHQLIHRCIWADIYTDLFDGTESPGFLDPTEFFDGVYFVGQSRVSSWAIDTGAGLIIIDTLDNAEEAASILIPGIEHFGFTGHDIAAVIITHEHADHFGGAKYLQDTYGVPTFASAIAWDALAAWESQGGPVRNETFADGQILTIGNVSIQSIATPGHTPGCISLIFNVTDHGTPHTVGFYGGGGINANATLKAAQLQSYRDFAPIARDAGVDIYFTNHQIYDETVATNELLRVRQCDGSGCVQEHPWVYGVDDYQRWLSIMGLCVQLQAARVGQDLPI